MPVPDFSPGEVLTAAAMDSIGLWLVTTQTVGAGVSSVTVPNAFNANFDNYKIVITGVDSSLDGNGLKLKLDGIATAVYSSSFVEMPYSGGAAQRNGYVNDAGGVYVGVTTTSDDIHSFIDLHAPFKTKRKTYTFSSSSANTNTSGGGYINSTTSCTAFTIDPDGAVTLTGGTIRVYGYRD
jgi:hypothetical protein